jgi:hydroxyethylthiazole kinase
MVTADTVWSDVERIRDTTPLVHSITNYVVMNTTANALLAIGASPVMAHAREEVADMVSAAGALVVNVGTLEPAWVEAMEIAMRRADELGTPIVLDPVGVGATPYRTDATQGLVDAVAPTIIRGNASEILALATADARTRGVDSADAADDALEAAAALYRKHGSVVAVTGATDYVVADRTVRLTGGHPLMGRVTGTGCTATVLCAAFAAVDASAPDATVGALAAFGAAGAEAGDRAEGPGTMQLHLYDALYGLTREQIDRHVTVEEV